jgi:PAS domain S-box-containing protein
VAPVESDSARFSSALRAAIVWPSALILFASALMLGMIVLLLNYQRWSNHSYAVITQTRICEEIVSGIQAGYRGFLLTGDPSLVGAYPDRRAKADDAFASLAQMVQDNPPQEARAQGLIRAKNGWLDYVKVMLDQQNAKHHVDPAWIEMGDKMANGIRAQFDDFDQVEEKLHADRAAAAQDSRRALIVGGGLLTIVLAFAIAFQVRRQFKALAGEYREALVTIEQRHSELRRSEADLEQQKEWFRVTLTSIGDGVIVTDKEARVVFLNREAEVLTGWTSVEALLKPLSTVFHIINENTREREEDPSVTVFRERRVVAMSNHVALVSRMGEECPIEDSAAPIHDAQGALIGVVVVFHNATSSRRARRDLRAQNLELEKRVAERTVALQQTVTELEAFSYSVSHDLRSPLRAMQGFAQALVEDFGDKLDGQGRDYLDRIKNAALRLDRLIQDLLLFTRVSRHDTELMPVDAEAILRDLLANYPNLNPPAASVEVIGRLPRVLGQATSLTQVLSNLLGNAAKFVRPGTVPKIKVWSEDLGERVRIFVEDNGIGIDPKNYERIFQMFVQVGDSQLYGGTGMGLAIVKKAVEAMKGAVGVNPAEGGGCRFWVELTKAG